MRTLLRFQVSPKSLQAFEEYGLSEDPLLLQAQVRELKVHLENQIKLIHQMQSLERRNPVAGHHSDQLTNQGGAQIHHARPSREQMREKDCDKEAPAIIGETSEAERKKSAKEQLQHARSRSASPARLQCNAVIHLKY